MKWLIFLSALLFSVTVISSNYTQSKAQNTDQKPYKMPEFTHHKANEWINSQPLTVQDLKGKVVLIDMWTFDCWNCYRSFPWLNALEEKYQKSGLQIIGVHTPEFDHEKIRVNIEAKVKKFKLHHPVMIDNDFSYWRALNNRYWPAYYLVNQEGNIVSSHIGETHQGDQRHLLWKKK
ncbi:MAG: redoxin domain-containing protein [gamma proteobacterium symbiont of Lucinoma myriamae]|nr:redoxin domain-containing protein [gamma proteobacterium symbiont of Lucinoma myriamae]MCU7833414.1 redoxin domain-containing protein [gamma proteobacterium symbiont of Lucinoma myriamae]